MDKMNERELNNFLDKSTEMFRLYFEGTPEEGLISLKERIKIMIEQRVKVKLEWIGLK